MLDFKGISVHYGHQDVLTDVTFRVNKGDRVGVVGPNGSGKSTLFKIVLGEMSTDSGELIIEGSPRIGFTRQNPEPDSPDETLLEYSLRGIPGLSEMEAEMQELEGDLTDPAKMRRYGELLERERPEIGLLINAAGCGVFGPFAEKDLDQLLMSARLNALALTAMCHVSLPYMKAGSAIVNMGSNSAWQPVPWQAVYGASKSYVLNLSRAIGRELKPKGIHVMCVCPGWIKTEFQKTARHEDYIRYVDRWYGPEEVAEQAMKDLRKKKTVSILGHPVRRQVRLVKFLPVKLVMDIWCRGRTEYAAAGL